MVKRRYHTPDGKEYPLEEARYNYSITCYKTDCRKAEIGDPEQCLIALGAKRDKAVLSAHIGSGKDAYIVFKSARGKPAHALHYTINAKAGRLRDYFDTHKGVATQTITLSAPTAGRTLAHRSKLNKARLKRIKAGKHVVKKRTKPAKTRIIRLGVPHRPPAKIEGNVISITPREVA